MLLRILLYITLSAVILTGCKQKSPLEWEAPPPEEKPGIITMEDEDSISLVADSSAISCDAVIAWAWDSSDDSDADIITINNDEKITTED